MTLDARKQELERDGYTIISDALTPSEVVGAQRAVEELLAVEETVARTTGTQTDNLRNSHAILGKLRISMSSS